MNNICTPRIKLLKYILGVHTNLPMVTTIRGYAPPIDPAGEKRPLYMRLAGTGDVLPWSTDVQVQTKDMAMRGLVALSVNYDNAVYPLVCDSFYAKAKAIFNPQETDSAVSVLCDLQTNDESLKSKIEALQIDCDKGIVVEGFSQGSNLANLAKNYDDNVQAVFLKGDVEPTAQGCYDKAITAIPKERMRSFMGQEDCFGNSGDMTPQEVLEATTGYSSSDCESDQNCIQEDESGWFIVEPRMMNSDTAIHCYFWPPYKGNSCIAKTNLQYNKNPFQLNYYCGELVPSDDGIKCPPQSKEFTMVKSHDWLTKYVTLPESSRALWAPRKTEERASSSSGALVAVAEEKKGRDLRMLSSPQKKHPRDLNCNLCGGRTGLIFSSDASQKLIENINEMTDQVESGGIFYGYVGQHTSCEEFQEALEAMVPELSKDECSKLRRHLLYTIAISGTPSTCEVVCPADERFSKKKKVPTAKIAEALDIPVSSLFSDNVDVTCGDLASRVHLLASFTGMEEEECEYLQHAASYCCDAGSTKSGK